MGLAGRKVGDMLNAYTPDVDMLVDVGNVAVNMLKTRRRCETLRADVESLQPNTLTEERQIVRREFEQSKDAGTKIHYGG